MNDAHLHLLVNHFPIIGTIIGAAILFVGMLKKDNTIKSVAYTLFIFTAIFAFASMYTGEGAEEFTEDLPSIDGKLIHQHEEIAEKLAITLYILGFVSIAGLYNSIKKRNNSKLISFIALTIAIVAVILARETGTTGGEIHHTEIRDDNTNFDNTDSNDDETLEKE